MEGYLSEGGATGSHAGDQKISASPALEALMQVQEYDLAIDQLLYRRSHLEAISALDACMKRVGKIASERQRVAAERDAAIARQDGLEADIAQASERIRSIEKRMYGGEVSAARELEAMAHEVEHIASRRSELEDAEIQCMEELEPLDQAIAALDKDAAEAEAQATRLEERAHAECDAIDEEVASIAKQRDDAAGGIPGDLLAQYEAIRKHLGGQGAARLLHGVCTGCHLSLPAVEHQRAMHADPGAIITCEQCGRILVR